MMRGSRQKTSTNHGELEQAVTAAPPQLLAKICAYLLFISFFIYTFFVSFVYLCIFLFSFSYYAIFVRVFHYFSCLWGIIRLSRCGHLRKSELQNTTRASAAFHYTEPPDTASIACATAGQGTVVDRGMHTHTQYTHNLSRWACMDTKQRWSYNMGAVPTPLACPRIARRGVAMYVYAARSVGSAPQVAAPPPCGGGVHLAMQG